MRKVIVVAGVLATVLSLSLAGTASAAPDNKNTETLPVNCEGFGEIEVTEVAPHVGEEDEGEEERGNRGRGGALGVGFADSQVLVLKSFSGEVELHFEIDGGPTFDLSFQEGEVAVPGKGFQDRLIECTFTDEFSETFKLEGEALAHLEADTGEELDAFEGADVTLSGTFTGTAHVLTPGSNK